MANAFFFQRLNDHVQYLKKIQATLDDKDSFQGTSHTDCKLGKWLYSDGPIEAETVGHDAKLLFDTLLEPHQHFHDASKLALEKKMAGDLAGAEQNVTQMLQLSAILVNKLLELDRLANDPVYSDSDSAKVS